MQEADVERRMDEGLRAWMERLGYEDGMCDEDDYAAGARDLTRRVAEALSPVVGAEVRVEWGVRIGERFLRCDRESDARELANTTNGRAEQQTITTYADGSFLTSAWQPVTDEQEQA